MVIATQRLICKASYKKPIFHNVIQLLSKLHTNLVTHVWILKLMDKFLLSITRIDNNEQDNEGEVTSPISNGKMFTIDDVCGQKPKYSFAKVSLQAKAPKECSKCSFEKQKAFVAHSLISTKKKASRFEL
jgi:hypothetical protein